MRAFRGTFASTLTTTLLVTGAGAFACSGPGAARAIRVSEEIGSACAGISAAIIAVGCVLAWRRYQVARIPWMIAPMLIHPNWWMDAVHGDCGHGLVLFSAVATVVIALVVMLVLTIPNRQATPTQGRWTRAGAFAGALVGLFLAVMAGMAGIAPDEKSGLILAFSVFAGTTLAGGLAGGGLFRRRAEGVPWGRFRVSTLLLLPVALAPLFVVLAPVLPYEGSVSMSRPFRFVVIDASGAPIRGATVQVIDPEFASNDIENQWPPEVTGADGSVEYSLFANMYGRHGLLGETETITYSPQLIRVVAPGYWPFLTSLAADPPIPGQRITAPPLDLPFPPPPSATIQMTPIAPDRGR